MSGEGDGFTGVHFEWLGRIDRMFIAEQAIDAAGIAVGEDEALIGAGEAATELEALRDWKLAGLRIVRHQRQWAFPGHGRTGQRGPVFVRMGARDADKGEREQNSKAESMLHACDWMPLCAISQPPTVNNQEGGEALRVQQAASKRGVECRLLSAPRCVKLRVLSGTLASILKIQSRR